MPLKCNTMSETILPPLVIAFAIAPFLDRLTLNNLALSSKEMADALQAIVRPWPASDLRIDNIVQCLTFSPDGDTVACRDRAGRITMGKRQNGQQISIEGFKCSILSNIAYSPAGGLLAFGIEQGAICLLNTTDITHSSSLVGHDGAVYSVCFSPVGHTLATAGTDGNVRLWDVKNKICLKTMQEHGGYIYSLAFSPDGKTLVSSGTDKIVRLWTLSTSQCVPLYGHSLVVVSVAYSPNGRYVASGSLDSTVRLWNISDHSCQRTLMTGSEVLNVSFSIDSTVIAVGLATDIVALWNFEDSDNASTELQGRVAAFAPDGYTVAVGGSGEAISLRNIHQLHNNRS
jgi:WD40 repeat protein